MENNIKQIMASVLEVNISDINENSSPDTIATWDSLNHMKLVLALEEEFKVEFSEQDIVDMLTFKLICLTLKEKLTDRK